MNRRIFTRRKTEDNRPPATFLTENTSVPLSVLPPEVQPEPGYKAVDETLLDSLRRIVRVWVDGVAVEVSAFFNKETDTLDDIADGSAKLSVTAEEKTKLAGATTKAYVDGEVADLGDYVDLKIGQTVAYVDTQVATRETPAGAQAKADAALDDAKAYTDSKTWDDVETPEGAQAKADAARDEAKDYADGLVVGLATEGYADAKALEALDSAEDYVNLIVGDLETKADATAKLTEAKGYTDTQVATRETPAGAQAKADVVKTYVDTRNGVAWPTQNLAPWSATPEKSSVGVYAHEFIFVTLDSMGIKVGDTISALCEVKTDGGTESVQLRIEFWSDTAFVQLTQGTTAKGTEYQRVRAEGAVVPVGATRFKAFIMNQASSPTERKYSRNVMVHLGPRALPYVAPPLKETDAYSTIEKRAYMNGSGFVAGNDTGAPLSRTLAYVYPTYSAADQKFYLPFHLPRGARLKRVYVDGYNTAGVGASTVRLYRKQNYWTNAPVTTLLATFAMPNTGYSRVDVTTLNDLADYDMSYVLEWTATNNTGTGGVQSTRIVGCLFQYDAPDWKTTL